MFRKDIIDCCGLLVVVSVGGGVGEALHQMVHVFLSDICDTEIVYHEREADRHRVVLPVSQCNFNWMVPVLF